MLTRLAEGQKAAKHPFEIVRSQDHPMSFDVACIVHPGWSAFGGCIGDISG